MKWVIKCGGFCCGLTKIKFLHVVIIVSEGNSHVVLSVMLMHALDPQSSQFSVQPIETPPVSLN